MSVNLASRFAKEVDERFTRESQAAMALSNNYKFTGVKTVKVYSIPVVPLNDYTRSGANRYGQPMDLGNEVQDLTISLDKGWTFVIDKGDKIQSEMVMDCGRAVSRQLREVIVPYYDTYVFRKLAAAAVENGNTDSTELTKDNAYAHFLKGMEALGNKNVPDKGRICFCTYGFANLLKQDPAFMKYSNLSQEMIIKGVIGEVDGCKIVKVPSSRLPAGAAFLLTHPIAACGPKQLEEYKIHDNPPGISGWLAEGRIVFDCFVLNNKADAIYYHGAQPKLQTLLVETAGTTNGKSRLIVDPATPDDGITYKYQTKATKAALDTVTAGTAVTTANWTAMPAVTEQNPAGDFTVTSGHKFVAVVGIDSANKPVTYGTAKLNIGV